MLEVVKTALRDLSIKARLHFGRRSEIQPNQPNLAPGQTMPNRRLPWPLKALLYTLAAAAVLIVVILFFAIDDTPLLKIHHGLNRDDIQRAKQILHIAPEDRDKIRTITLNGNDINVAASYLLDHFAENTVQIEIGQDMLFAQIAIFVPKTLWGRYLDFSFKLLQKDGGIKIKSLKIGEISIPDPLANYLIEAAAQWPTLNKYWLLAKHYVKSLRINPGNVEVSYVGSIVAEAKQLVIQKHREYPNLHLYQQQINEIVTNHDPAWRLSLTDLLQPLFSAAYQRSDDATAARENRAVIIAVASYIYKQELRRYLPLGLVYSKEYPVFAYRRIDIPQHFIASALFAAVDASLLGEQLGEDKELADSEHGSGFSFIDLNSDRAGTRFGKLAVSSPSTARNLQRIMSVTKDYSAIIPDAQDLPEHLDEQSFKQIYGRIGSPAYTALVDKIDSRLDALPIYNQR